MSRIDDIDNHMNGHGDEDWDEGPREEDADEGYDRLRQNEVDDSLFGVAKSISRLQGLSMARKQAE